MKPLTTVHGREYRSIAEMRDRMAELHLLNRELGPSDGRVTERDALIAEVNRLTPGPRIVIHYAYYRTATGRKGYREFRSEAALSRFVHTTDYAITAHGSTSRSAR